jgi:hypothetical protein
MLPCTLAPLNGSVCLSLWPWCWHALPASSTPFVSQAPRSALAACRAPLPSARRMLCCRHRCCVLPLGGGPPASPRPSRPVPPACLAASLWHLLAGACCAHPPAARRCLQPLMPKLRKMLSRVTDDRANIIQVRMDCRWYDGMRSFALLQLLSPPPPPRLSAFGILQEHLQRVCVLCSVSVLSRHTGISIVIPVP